MARKKQSEEAVPMDATAPEVSQPTEAVNHYRVAYALQTLVSEVEALFPEVPREFTDVNGRNTALGVVFDDTTLDGDVRDSFEALLAAITTDERVAEVIIERNAVYVRLHNNPRTQDSRETFDLGDLWSVLTEDVIDRDDDFDLIEDAEAVAVEPFVLGQSYASSSSEGSW